MTISEAWALELVMIRLKRRAWGGIPFTIAEPDACSQALSAIEELVLARSEAEEMRAVFAAFEFAEQRRHRAQSLAERVLALPSSFPALAVWSLNAIDRPPRDKLARAASWEVQALVFEARGDVVGAATARARAEECIPIEEPSNG